MTANIVQVSADHPDVNRLAALFDDYRTHYGQPPGLAAVRTWLLEQLTQGRLTVTAAVEADQMLGFISMTVLPASLRLGTALSIRDLFVAPQHRRRGIAGSLLQHAIVNAREDGAQRVSLQTEAGNMPALTLYRAAGFRSVEGLEVLNLHLADSEHQVSRYATRTHENEQAPLLPTTGESILVDVGWALSQPARSSTGAYYEVAASPRGDALLWYPGTGPLSPNNATPGVLGILSFFVNKIAFKGRWRVVVRQFAETRDVRPTAGLLWHKDVRKREVHPLMTTLVQRIEAGTFIPEQSIDGVLQLPLSLRT